MTNEAATAIDLTTDTPSLGQLYVEILLPPNNRGADRVVCYLPAQLSEGQLLRAVAARCQIMDE
eukprot:12237261-Prorocentrum_lima.AAC.1